MIIFHKKSEAGLTIIIVVIIVVLFLGWIVNITQRECRTNKDCGAESYCGSDFACHSYPTIQKTIVQYNFLIPSIIIGIAIVIAAMIFRQGKRQEEPKPEHVSVSTKATEEIKPEEIEVSEPYYESKDKAYYKSDNAVNSNIKTP